MNFFVKPPSRAEFYLCGFLLVVCIILVIRVFFYWTPVDDVVRLKTEVAVIQSELEVNRITDSMQNNVQERMERFMLEIIKFHSAFEELSRMRREQLVNDKKNPKRVRRRKR
jgi:hypothetical protein